MSVEYLYSLGFNQVKPGLERIKELLDNLDNPQDNFRSIHVAGTNGKGSVCAFLTSILTKAGYRVGTFTSPHLVDFRERIKINNQMIPENSLDSLIARLKPFITDQSFFEVVTALAFQYFSEQNVDFAVVETGMGGRLDATNVLQPDASVITNIAIDHSEYLGKTFKEIAHEKSGVIKDAPVITTSEDYVTKDCDLRIASPYNGPMSMRGNFQKINAGIAREVAKALDIDDEIIIEGIKNTYWPGRLDYIDNIIFDAAHNVEGIKNLQEVDCDVFVLGIMKDKDIAGMCRALPNAKVIACKPRMERSLEPEEIKKHIDCEIIEDVCKAINYAKSYGRVCVTGSIFTVGEAFECLGLKPFNTQVD